MHKNRQTENEKAYISLYDDQVPCYLLIVESFSENYRSKQSQGDVKGSVGCLKHTQIQNTHRHSKSFTTTKGPAVLFFFHF